MDGGGLELEKLAAIGVVLFFFVDLFFLVLNGSRWKWNVRDKCL